MIFILDEQSGYDLREFVGYSYNNYNGHTGKTLL